MNDDQYRRIREVRNDEYYYGALAQFVRKLVISGIQYLKERRVSVGYTLTHPSYLASKDDVRVYIVRAEGFLSREFTGRTAAREYRTELKKKLSKGKTVHIYRYTFDSSIGLIIDVREVW